MQKDMENKERIFKCSCGKDLDRVTFPIRTIDAAFNLYCSVCNRIYAIRADIPYDRYHARRFDVIDSGVTSVVENGQVNKSLHDYKAFYSRKEYEIMLLKYMKERRLNTVNLLT